MTLVGGPGGAGVGLIPGFGPFLSEQLGGTYDIISWDPRGVGKYTLCVFFSGFDLHARFDDDTSVTIAQEKSHVSRLRKNRKGSSRTRLCGR